jgi:hypothetical protein
LTPSSNEHPQNSQHDRKQIASQLLSFIFIPQRYRNF